MQEQVTESSKKFAWLCVGVFFVSLLFIRPIAEIGMLDDWSYIRTAQLLAQTGHIHYNGWATAMLGIQLVPAAVLIRLLGFSFTIARVSTILTSALTIFILQRCAVRCGLTNRNATFATLLVSTSPLFLPLATIFMSDATGLLSVVLCFYCCLRAVQGRHPSAWLMMGFTCSVVGGTSRQIAWLGALVMVPSALFVLRRTRPLIISVALGWIASGFLIAAALHWFHAQPYSVPEAVLAGKLTRASLENLFSSFLPFFLETLLLILPLLLSFLFLLFRRDQWRPAMALGTTLLCLFLLRRHIWAWIPPALTHPGDVLGRFGMFQTIPVFGPRPELPTKGLKLILATLLVGSLGGFIYAIGTAKTPPCLPPHRWPVLLALIVPFSCSYVMLLAPRATFIYLFDRYALPLIPLLSILLTRFAQDRRTMQRWHALVVALACFAIYGIALTHDLFAVYRSAAGAISSVNRRGISSGDVYGGWEYASLLQVEKEGFVHEPKLHLHEDQALLASANSHRACPLLAPNLYPNVQPEYALAFRTDECKGAIPLPPIRYFGWLPPGWRSVWVVRNTPDPRR